jgi:hypothetical protein
LRQGIERLQFVRANYDSLLGRFFQPITNEYSLTAITNSTPYPQRVQRVIAAPDFLFSAEDLTAGQAVNMLTRNVNFSTNGVGTGLAGPGTIETSSRIAFNKVGPIYFNYSPNAYFMQTAEANQTPMLIWGSFDGSTNPPIAYPNGTSIRNLENQVLIQPDPLPPTLPPGTNRVFYSRQLTAMGGQPPYTWALANGSANLPTALTLSAGGLLSGTPNAVGTFDNIVIQLNDSANRSVSWVYSITINPQ